MIYVDSILNLGADGSTTYRFRHPTDIPFAKESKVVLVIYKVVY